MSGERSLPKGWIVRESNSYPGKVYYFNTDTGESIWEHPDLMNCSVSNEFRQKRSSNVNDDFTGIPDFEFKDDPRVEQLEKLVYKRLSKSVSDSEKQIHSKKLKKSFNIPTAVVTPVLSDKDRLSKEYSKFNVPNQDPRLFRQIMPSTSRLPDFSCENPKIVHHLGLIGTPPNRTYAMLPGANDDESDMSSPGSNENQDFSNPDSNESIDSQISGSPNLEQREECISFNLGLYPSKESSNLANDNYPIAVKKSVKSIDYYFVVDTNVLLGDLRLVSKIFYSSIGKNNISHLFIPWVVIQEIDNLLRRYPKDHKLYHMAKACSKFINGIVRKKDPRFHCQTVQEVKEWAKDYSECNDDRLIECCLSLAEKLPRAQVILVTNDVHLDTKAHIFGIPIFSIKDLLSKFNFECNIRKTKLSPKIFKAVQTKFTVKSLEPVEEKVNENRKWSCVRSLPGKATTKKEKSQILSEAFLELKNVLHPFLIGEFRKVHGDGWKSLNLNLSSMKGILGVIVQFWESIFAPNFSPKLRRNFELLYERFKSLDYSKFTKNDCLNSLTAIENIFCDIKRKCSNIDINIENIQDMRVACIEQFSNCSTNATAEQPTDTLEKTETEVSTDTVDASVTDSVDQISEYEVVSKVFDYNWTVIHQLCGVISDFYGITHDLDYEKLDVIPPKSEVERVIHKLCPSLEEIKILMWEIIRTDCTHSPLDYEKFASLMKGFVPTLNIQTESIDMTRFNAKCLANFCQSPVNSEILIGGYKQLEIYFSKIRKVLTMTLQ